jgi:hypothetical protein
MYFTTHGRPTMSPDLTKDEHACLQLDWKPQLQLSGSRCPTPLDRMATDMDPVDVTVLLHYWRYTYLYASRVLLHNRK